MCPHNIWVARETGLTCTCLWERAGWPSFPIFLFGHPRLSLNRVATENHGLAHAWPQSFGIPDQFQGIETGFPPTRHTAARANYKISTYATAWALVRGQLLRCTWNPSTSYEHRAGLESLVICAETALKVRPMHAECPLTRQGSMPKPLTCCPCLPVWCRPSVACHFQAQHQSIIYLPCTASYSLPCHPLDAAWLPVCPHPRTRACVRTCMYACTHARLCMCILT